MGEKAILPAANINVLPKCCVDIISFQGNLLLTPGLRAHGMVAAPGNNWIPASGRVTEQLKYQISALLRCSSDGFALPSS